MKPKTALLAVLLLATIAIAGGNPAQAGRAGNLRALTGPDLYIQDTPLDAGLEPNPVSGPMWVSQDIWVRQSPDPAWQPFAFNAGSPPWGPPAGQRPAHNSHATQGGGIRV